jgi:predicted HicB family RNase H-like nuclease
MSDKSQINVRVDVELRERLEALAREEFGEFGGSLSLWVRRALREAARRDSAPQSQEVRA